MNPPVVSVIVPIYETARHLEQCLTSVIQQTLQELEIIAVNDASPDDAGFVLQRIADRDSRIVSITHDTNQGQGEARNTGILAARGKFVFFLDSDDYLPPQALKALCEIAEEHGNEIVIGRAQSRMPVDAAYTKCELRAVTLENYPALLYNHSVWNKLFRRDYLTKNGFLFNPPRYAEDISFSIRTNMAAKSISVTRQTTYCYRAGRQIKFATKGKVIDARKNVTEALWFVEKSGSEFLRHEMRRKTARNSYASMVRAHRALSRPELCEHLLAWKSVLIGMPEAVFQSVPTDIAKFCRFVADGRLDDAIRQWRKGHHRRVLMNGAKSAFKALTHAMELISRQGQAR